MWLIDTIISPPLNLVLSVYKAPPWGHYLFKVALALAASASVARRKAPKQSPTERVVFNYIGAQRAVPEKSNLVALCEGSCGYWVICYDFETTLTCGI